MNPEKTSRQARAEDTVRAAAQDREPSDGTEEEQGSEDEASTRPTTAIAGEQQRTPSPANTLVSSQLPDLQMLSRQAFLVLRWRC